MRLGSTEGWYARMRSMSCSAWSMVASACVRDPSKTSNTPPGARQCVAGPPSSSRPGDLLMDALSESVAASCPLRHLTRRAGVYVHFPWCLAKCPYCDFVSYVSPADIDHEGYADAVLRELDARAPLLEGRRIESIFFGGGTPSLWDARHLGRVIAGVRAAFHADLAESVEVTVECNPTSLDDDVAQS